MKDTVCIYSGGMDSYTLVRAMHTEGRLHSCLLFDYGQRHRHELSVARDVCIKLDIPFHFVNLRVLNELLPYGSSPLVKPGEPMPHGKYDGENMRATVVPNRNMVMLSLAVAYAQAHKLKRVAYGAHAGDHTIYPDCRAEFIDKLDKAIRISGWEEVSLFVPFTYSTKADILQVGFSIGADYSETWTCYDPQLGAEGSPARLACGKCGSCQERLEAFKLVGRPDPLPYVTRELL